MTLRVIVRWWWQDLRDWWRWHHWRPTSQPVCREGRMVRFSSDGVNMGYTSYTVWARRGHFHIGRLEYRNQWGTYAFYPTKDGVSTPLNKAIMAEIYALLKELGS